MWQKRLQRLHEWKLAVRITPNATENLFSIWQTNECFATSAESRRTTTSITKKIIDIVLSSTDEQMQTIETAIPNWTPLCRRLATLFAKRGTHTNNTQTHSSKPTTSASLTQSHVSYSSLIHFVKWPNSRPRSPLRRRLDCRRSICPHQRTQSTHCAGKQRRERKPNL